MKIAREIAAIHYPLSGIHRAGLELLIAERLDPVRDALAAIAGPCERLTSHRCIDEPDRYTVGAYYGDDRVCDACVADRALALFEEV